MANMPELCPPLEVDPVAAFWVATVVGTLLLVVGLTCNTFVAAVYNTTHGKDAVQVYVTMIK